MLKITIPAIEQYDELKGEFLNSKEYILQLEHSLVSLSKWESHWRKPFLAKDVKTIDETIDYIKCMTITQNIEPKCYNNITNENITQVRDYIEAEMTATTFAKKQEPPSRQIITAELIYYWMISLNIPMECQKWHLDRLLTLINVCNVKNAPPKKMGKRELAQRNRDMNSSRRKALQSEG